MINDKFQSFTNKTPKNSNPEQKDNIQEKKSNKIHDLMN